MTMHCFLVDQESTAISVVAWDLELRKAIFVYKSNGIPASQGYLYENINQDDMIDALLGDKSLGQYVNALKDPSSPAKQSEARFGNTKITQSNVRSGKIKIHEGMEFFYDSVKIGNLNLLKKIRDEKAAGNPFPLSIVISNVQPATQRFLLEHLPSETSYSW